MNTVFANHPSLFSESSPTPSQLEKLQKYVDLLIQWNKAYNLIGKSTEAEVWQRHILDCAQLVPLLNSDDTVLDIGSGAGLPSVVLAIMSTAKITACETNTKRTDFLREVRRQLGLQDNFDILEMKAQSIPRQNQYSVITARAVAELKDLLTWTENLLLPTGRYVFLKGDTARFEISGLPEQIQMTTKRIPSITSSKGEIVVIQT